MTRARDRVSADGLLPRMEARPWKDGKTISYRYLKFDGTWEPLGTEKAVALRKVLDMNGLNDDRGTIAELWRIYQESPEWADLSEYTRTDYTQCWKELERRFAKATAGSITPSVMARYLRKERKSAPIRANRECALMSNLMNIAVEQGDILANPCKQVRRNKERPRPDAPEPATLVAFLEWARKRPGQAQVLAGAAEFAALSGNRKIEFTTLHWPQVGEVVRMFRGKQRNGQVVVELLAISNALEDLFARMRLLAKDAKVGAVFPTISGNPYTPSGFKAMWGKLMNKALAEKAIDKRFTFHDLRAYYVTQHKALRGALPDLHKNPATTAGIYDRTKTVKRGSL